MGSVADSSLGKTASTRCKRAFPNLPARPSIAACRLPDLDGSRSNPKKKFKKYPIGYFYVDLTEERTGEGKFYLFVAMDRTSKFAFTHLVERVTRRATADFLRELIATIPYRIHTVLTDNAPTSPPRATLIRRPLTSNWLLKRPVPAIISIIV